MADPNESTAAERPAPGAKGRTPRGRRRVLRTVVRLAVGLALLLVIVALGLMRSPVVGRIAAQQIKALTGADLKSGSSILSLDGRVTLKRVSLRARGVGGRELEILNAERIDVDMGWSGVWAGNVRPLRLRMHDPVFRVSQSLDDGTLNLSAITSAPSTPGGAGRLPQIDVFGATLELAEHSASRGPGGTPTYQVLKSLSIAGTMLPVERDQRVYSVQLHETGPRATGAPGTGGGAAPMRRLSLEGRFDLARDELTMRLKNLSLDDWGPESVPESFRALWRRLNIRGRISETTVAYSSGAGVSVTLRLDGVSMSALVPAENAEDPDGTLSLSEVSGEITLAREGLRARLTGLVEDQDKPSSVNLSTTGLELSSALRCEIISERISVESHADLLPYAPRQVRRYFEKFNNPTGDIDARVLILRGPAGPDGPASVTVEGSLVLRNVRAAFEKFPYPFEDLRGQVLFTSNSIEILDLRGRGPTGAMLSAAGTIRPLHEDAGVDLRLFILDAPIDDLLKQSMPEGKRRVIDVLFARDALASMRAAGLIAPAGTRVAPGDPGPPSFTLGGKAQLAIHILREEGPADEWRTTIDLELPTVGILPEPFPFPMVGEGVKVRITDEEATLLEGRFRGLRGGEAEMTVHVLLEEEGKPVLRPRLTILARSTPVDDLLLFAIPEKVSSAAQGPPEERKLTAKKILRSLRPGGEVSCEAKISEDAAGETDYDVQVVLDGLAAHPLALDGKADGAIRLEGISGDISVTPRELSVRSLTGDLRWADAERSGEGSQGRLAMNVRVDLEESPPEVEPGRETEGSLVADTRVESLHIGAPFEELIAVVAPEVAKRLAELRSARDIAGRLDVEARATATSESDPYVWIRLTNPRGLEAAALGGRVRIESAAGAMVMTTGRGGGDTPRIAGGVAFDSFRTSPSFDGEAIGDLSLAGGFRMDEESMRPRGPADFTATLDGARLESRVARAVVRSLAGDETSAAWQKLQAAGEVRVAARVAGTHEELELSGSIEPRSLRFRASEESPTLEFDSVAGVVRFTSPLSLGEAELPPRSTALRGTLEGLEVSTSGWRATGDGTFTTQQGLLDVRGRIGVSGSAIDGQLRSLLPSDVSGAMESIELAIGPSGGFDMEDATVALAQRLGEGVESFLFDGDFRLRNGSMDFGVPVRELDAVASVRAAGSAGQLPDLRIDLESGRARVGDVPFTGLRAVLISADSSEGSTLLTVPLRAPGDEGTEAGTVPGTKDGLVIPYFWAECFGGNVVGSVAVRPAAKDGSAPGRYAAEMTVAGVQLAPLLRSLDDDVRNDNAGADATRGLVDAWATLKGEVGNPASRSGRATARIAEGNVLNLPLVMPLMQISNLQLPWWDVMDYFEMSVYLEGNEVTIERLSLLSDSVAMVGRGTARLPEMTLDLTFNSKAARRLPVLSDVLETVRDELITTVVRGTLANPSVRAEAFVGTRRLLGSIFDRSEPEEFMNSSIVEREARAERQRLRAGRRGE